jgi:hypothetical protein
MPFMVINVCANRVMATYREIHIKLITSISLEHETVHAFWYTIALVYDGHFSKWPQKVSKCMEHFEIS